MKIRLLALTLPDFSPSDVLLTALPSYTQTGGGSNGFTDCADMISTSCSIKPSFIRTDTIFPFSSDLEYASETTGEDHSNIYHVSSLNV